MAGLAAISQAAHFVPVSSNTGNSTNISIQASINPTKNGLPLQVGDEIGVFDTGMHCYGALRWSGSGYVIARGTSQFATSKVGFYDNDVMYFRIWDSAGAKEMRAVVAYSMGDSLYSQTKLCVLSLLAALPEPPGAPVLAVPTNGATGQSLSLTLQWNSVAAATGYAVQVSTGTAFSTFIKDDSSATTTYSPTGLAGGTTCYWRVAGRNLGGTGTWSSTWSFTTVVNAPSLSTPTNGTANLQSPVSLTWASVVGAATYGVQVSTGSAFASTVYNATGLAVRSASVSGLATGATYYWRANATGNGVTGAWANLWSFSTAPLPNPPALATPTNGQQLPAPGGALTVSWAAVSGATSYGLQVSSTSAFTTRIIDTSKLTGGSFRVSGLKGSSTYFWRMNTTNGVGTGVWSTAWRFDITVPVQQRGTAIAKAAFSVKSGWIDYSIPAAGLVQFSFIDMRGRIALAVSKVQPAGSYRLSCAKLSLSPGRYLVGMKSAGIEKRASLTVTR